MGCQVMSPEEVVLLRVSPPFFEGNFAWWSMSTIHPFQKISCIWLLNQSELYRYRMLELWICMSYILLDGCTVDGSEIQLMLVVYPIIYKGFYTPQVVVYGISEPLTVWIFYKRDFSKDVFFVFPGRCHLHGQYDCFGAKSVDYLSINDDGIS